MKAKFKLSISLAIIFVALFSYITWGPLLPYSIVYTNSVIDGDTIEVNWRYRVRYIGIDTPETVHPNKSVEFYGPEASQENTRLVGKRLVRLVSDGPGKDPYDRLLRYVYLLDGTFVNEHLVENGFAYYVSYGNEFEFQTEFLEKEKKGKK